MPFWVNLLTKFLRGLHRGHHPLIIAEIRVLGEKTFTKRAEHVEALGKAGMYQQDERRGTTQIVDR